MCSMSVPLQFELHLVLVNIHPKLPVSLLSGFIMRLLYHYSYNKGIDSLIISFIIEIIPFIKAGKVV
jgi:hypothetical protein